MHYRSPLAELPLVSPPQAPDEMFSEAEAAVAALQARYDAATGVPAPALRRGDGGRGPRGALPRLLSAGEPHHRELRQGRLAAVVRARHRARALRDDDHPAAPLRGLPHRADRAPDPEPRDAGQGRHLGHADPAPLRHGRGRACGGLDRGRAAPAAARPLRRARPQHHRRPHRQRRRPDRAGRARGRWRRSPRSASTIRWRGSRTTRRRAPTHFQNHVLFTNYQFYMDEFVEFAARALAGSGLRLRGLRGARQLRDHPRRAGRARRRGGCRRCRPST